MAQLIVSEGVAKAIAVRLRRVEGQIKGLQRMVQDKRDCAEIAQQIAAARAALDRVAVDLISEGLEHCLREELAGRRNGRSTLRKLQHTFLMLH